MKKRKWTSQEKLPIVLEGLNGRIEITRLCAKYRIAQMQYYQWRDHLLKLGHQAFESKNITKKRMYLETMQKVLPKVERTFIVDENQSGILPLLNLDKGGK